MGYRAAPAFAALATALPLGGCVAAALAVPMMTVVGASEAGRTTVRAATPVPVAPEGSGFARASDETEAVASLAALPQSAVVSAAQLDRWRQFVSYALQQAAAGTAESALLTMDGGLELRQERRPCRDGEPAVIVDLDNGPAAFSPDAGLVAAPGLAASLARLREAGVVVLWISQASANEVQPIADVLHASGLDPTGRDPLLLVRHQDDRKQSMREEANEDVCVVAIAGDRRADFDELFDYLRRPEEGSLLDGMLGSGWFLVPPPFE